MKITAAKKQMLSLLLCTVLLCVFVPHGIVAYASASNGIRSTQPVALSDLKTAINDTAGTSASHFSYAGGGIEAWTEGNTRNIKLNADVEGSSGVAVGGGRTVVLDLNGYTISGTGSYVLGVAGGSTLTVRDNSSGPGSIIGNNMAINDQGTFHLESGTVRATNYAVYVTANASLTTSGTIESAYISIYAGGSVNIKSGAINAASYGVYANGTKSSVAVTGGTVNSDDCAICSMGGSVTVNDGVVNGAHDGVYVRENATFHMDGGKITGGNNGVDIYWGGTHEVSGGQIEGQFGLTIWGYYDKKTQSEPYGKTVLNFSGGTITSDYHGICGNARQDLDYKRGSTIINISGGDIRCTKDGVGIYHPQEGELNISGGSISGPTGVEMRGGKLTMTGGSVTGTAESLSGKISGNGNTTTGAGIAVSQHPENYAINVDISGGTITGYTSLYEDYFGDFYKYDDLNAKRKPVNLKITGGQFVSTGDASVISMHNTGFISGGSYSYGVDKDYLGTLTWDEAKAFSPAKEQPVGFTGAFSCIKGKVKSNHLPYHVGYLTGYPTPMITMHVGEKRPPFVPTYKLSKVDIEKVIGNAIVNVDANIDPDDPDGHVTVTHQEKGYGPFVENYEESLEPAIASWASGAPTVATVNSIGTDEPGVVTAKSVSPSPVNITATLFNGEQVDFFVTVGPNIPQTGDNTPVFLWIALLIVSCGGIAGTLAFHKEKNH